MQKFGGRTLTLHFIYIGSILILVNTVNWVTVRKVEQRHIIWDKGRNSIPYSYFQKSHLFSAVGLRLESYRRDQTSKSGTGQGNVARDKLPFK